MAGNSGKIRGADEELAWRIIGTDTPEPTATPQAHIAGRRGRSFPKVMTAGVSTNATELGRHSLVLARGTSRIQRKNGPRCRIVIKRSIYAV